MQDAPLPEVICPRYEIVHNYARIVRRPLTSLEQRAFLYLLDAEDRALIRRRSGRVHLT